jgi:hypothetical protein
MLELPQAGAVWHRPSSLCVVCTNKCNPPYLTLTWTSLQAIAQPMPACLLDPITGTCGQATAYGQCQCIEHASRRPVAGSISYCSGVRMVEHVDESQPMAIDAQPAITPARCGCECKACLSSPPMLVAGSMSHCSGVWMVESCSRWPSMLSRSSLQLDRMRCR